jgi:hypothetical protein
MALILPGVAAPLGRIIDTRSPARVGGSVGFKGTMTARLVLVT